MQAVADAVGYVRQRPEQFFRTGTPKPIELVTHIVSETFVLGGEKTCAVRRGDWWIIRSDVDWLGRTQITPQRPCSSISSLCLKLVPTRCELRFC